MTVCVRFDGGTTPKERHVASAPIEIDEATCLQLLSGSHAGRLALNDPDGPFVAPVNHSVIDGDIVIRSAVGTRLEQAASSAVASFQVDGIEEDHQRAWSVLARGTLEVVDDPEERDRLGAQLRHEPLAGGVRPYLVRLRIGQVSGRRISPAGGARPDTNTWYGRDGSDLLG